MSGEEVALGEEFVTNFLAHYADPYYDPVKAHEYYLQNRELQGRQSTSGLTVKYTTHHVSKKGKVGKAVQKVDKVATDRRKQAWTYAKKQIQTAEKTDVKSAAAAHKDVVKQAQATAQTQRKQLAAQLSAALKVLTQQHAAASAALSDHQKKALKKFAEDQKAKGKKISEDATKAIANLPDIPKGISDDARAKLIAERADKIAKIRGDALDGLTQLKADTKTGSADIAAGTVAQRKALTADEQAQKQTARTGAHATRDVVTAQLKTAVEKARVDYLTRKETLKAQYDATAQREYDAIKARV